MQKRELKNTFRRLLFLLTAVMLAVVLTGCATATQEKKLQAADAPQTEEAFVQKGESYTDKEHVACYIHRFGELPPNYITKKEAQALGWVSSKGNLWDVAPGKSIGGDRFGNYEGLLPAVKERTWTECDIDYDGGKRNGKRIVFSSDGLIYYTDDHYASFEEVRFDE